MVEAGVERSEVLQRAYEQTGADQQQQRQRYLNQHEHREQSPRGARDPTRAGVERRTRWDGPEGGRESKQHTRRDGDDTGEPEQPHVWREVENDRASASVREQRDEKAAADLRERHAKRRAQSGQHRALREQLADDPAAARADSETNRDLPLTRRGPRQQEIR